VIFVCVKDFFEHAAANHVISHVRHWSLATYDRAGIIRKPDSRQYILGSCVCVCVCVFVFVFVYKRWACIHWLLATLFPARSRPGHEILSMYEQVEFRVAYIEPNLHVAYSSS